MSYQILFKSGRKNADMRITTAYSLLEGLKEGNYVVHKTTRAGCTTALVSEFINRKQSFAVVVPTNHLAATTVIDEAKEYSDIGHADIVQIVSNHNCIKNQEMIAECEDLAQLPILPLPDNCEECEHYFECPVTEFERNDNTGVVITYQKLKALLLAARSSEHSTAARILRKLRHKFNFLFDEIHSEQFPQITTVPINQIKPMLYYRLPDDQFPKINEIMVEYEGLVYSHEIQILAMQVQQEVQSCEHPWTKHIAPQINRKDAPSHSTDWLVACFNEIVDLMRFRHKYGFSIEQVIDVYAVLNIITSDRLSLSVDKEEEFRVTINAIHSLFQKLLAEFVQRLEGRTMMTSATVVTSDISYLFGNQPFNSVLFGKGGDPLHNNDKMIVIGDNKKYSPVAPSNFGKDGEEGNDAKLLKKCKLIIDSAGEENVLVVCVNKTKQKFFLSRLRKAGYERVRVLYYGSPQLMGVKASERILVAIGDARKPAYTCDCMTDSTEESKRVLEQYVHSDTWQAWSRAKDPHGKVPSVVFAFGVRAEMCDNIVTWGSNRETRVWYKSHNQKYCRVDCSGKIVSKPKVYSVKSFEEALTLADSHTEGKYGLGDSVNKKYPFPVREERVETVESFLWYFIGRTDAVAEQSHDGGFVRLKGGFPFNDKMLENHHKFLNKQTTLGAYSLSEDSKTRYICFDVDAHLTDDMSETEVFEHQNNAELDRQSLEDYLSMYEIPYLVEYSGTPHSYHIWILTEWVDGKIAYHLGRKIAKEARVECEVNPKQKKITRSKFGNLVKLPLGVNRKNGLRGGFIFDGVKHEDFKPITLQIIDISDWKVDDKEARKVSIKKGGRVRRLSGIRPCIEAAIDKDLSGSQGNSMRVAIVAEYANFGIRDKEELTKLFEKQEDFDYEKSRYRVGIIVDEGYHPTSRSTLLEKCPDYLDCENCDRTDCKGF